jgi:GGDEF domain-containing protein
MEQARGMEKRLKKSLRDTISFTSGIAEFRDDDSAETLLSRADRNLLENKERQKKQGIHLAGIRETTGMESRQQSGV